MAFVYPGLGNQFAGMGRGLSVSLAGGLRAQDAENGFLRDQLDPRVWWADDAPHSFDGHRVPILGSVSLGSFVTDVLRGLGLAPDAAIGYSLGETAALVALRAWSRRDEMLRRLQVVAAVSHRAGRAVRCRPARLGHSGRASRWTGSPASFPVRWKPCARRSEARPG